VGILLRSGGPTTVGGVERIRASRLIIGAVPAIVFNIHFMCGLEA